MAVLAVLSTGPGAGGPPALDPLDLALVRGEAVFEALRTYGGRPFRLEARLEHLAARAIDAAGGGDLVLRLICTRGREGPGGGPVAFAICTDLPASFEEERRRGLRLVLLTTATDPLLRAAAPWLLAGVKTISYATNMAAQRMARSRGADDAILVGLGGELLEAPTATLWWRAGHTLHTPSLDLGILAGITRAVLLDLAPTLGLKVLEGVFTAEDLAVADEAFLSSSTRELMPVVEVDGAPIAAGHPGPVTADLQSALRRLATAR